MPQATKTASPIVQMTAEQKSSELMAWAHEGTEKSIKKIEEFINKETDEGLKEYAKIAKSEAECLYYSPTNEREERELSLARMIHDEDNQVVDLRMRVSALADKIDKMELEKSVFQKVLKKATAKKKKLWQYRFLEDFLTNRKHRLASLEDDIEYKEAWIKEAKSQIKTKRFQKLPWDFWANVLWDDEEIKEDDFGGCGGPGVCPECTSEHEDIKVEDIPF